jgi:hypothetical protein
MDAAAHLIMAMRDRPERIASALWDWLQQHSWDTEHLTDYLDCATATLERLALAPRPRPGADWEDDIEIITISLPINHTALRMLLSEHESPASREFGA